MHNIVQDENLAKVTYVKRTYCEQCDWQETNSSFWIELLQVADLESQTGNYTIVQCPKCSMAYTTPYPSDDTVKYLYMARTSSDFGLVDIVSKLSIVDKLRDYLAKKAMRKIIKATELKSVNSILDYGTGSGRFALLCHKILPQANIFALDFHEHAPRTLTQCPKIKYVIHGQLAEQEHKFDLIILRHVLEHVHQPQKLLEELGQYLTSDGVIYVEVPNLDSACAKVFKSLWHLWYVPRHLNHFNSLSLTKLINQGGFMVNLGRVSMPLMGTTLRHIFKKKTNNLSYQLLGILLYPLQVILEKFNRSSTCLYVICTKKALENKKMKELLL